MADNGFWEDAARQRHIQFGAGHGIDDRTLARERRAQAIFFPALARFRGEIETAAALSALMRDDFAYLNDALTDHAPTQDWWDERIAGAR